MEKKPKSFVSLFSSVAIFYHPIIQNVVNDIILSLMCLESQNACSYCRQTLLNIYLAVKYNYSLGVVEHR